MSDEQDLPMAEAASAEEQSRRSFLQAAGRFAVLTPPTVTLLLSTSMNSDAIAGSGGSAFPGGGATGGVFPGGGSTGGNFPGGGNGGGKGGKK